MATGLINSLLNPGMRVSGQMPSAQPVQPVQQTQRMAERPPEQTPELPRPVNRAGPRDMQAMSQYEAFSAQPLAGAGTGFSAIV